MRYLPTPVFLLFFFNPKFHSCFQFWIRRYSLCVCARYFHEVQSMKYSIFTLVSHCLNTRGKHVSEIPSKQKGCKLFLFFFKVFVVVHLNLKLENNVNQQRGRSIVLRNMGQTPTRETRRSTVCAFPRNSVS